MLKSCFIYGFDIDENNKYFYFEDNGVEYTAELYVGNYTMTTAGAELSRAMNEASPNSYGVLLDRQTRKYSIYSQDGIKVLGNSVSPAHCNEVFGFSGEESEIAMPMVSDFAAGKLYAPAFPLYNYARFEDSQDAGDATVSETSAGYAEVVMTGVVQEMECNIRYITNIVTPGDEYFGESGALDKANDFMRYITGKRRIEFCEDSQDLEAFTPCALQSTRRNKQGVGYRLQRMKIDGLFETGNLVFRKLEL